VPEDSDQRAVNRALNERQRRRKEEENREKEKRVAREARRREQVKRGEEPEPSTFTSSGSSDDSLTAQFRRQEEATGRPMSPRTLRDLEETALSRSRGAESASRPSAQALDRRGRTSSNPRSRSPGTSSRGSRKDARGVP
jgi:hypothetical protein